MNDRNGKICRFCLKIICEFDVIGEITRQMLDALLLDQNLDISKKNVMCHSCATKLQNAVDFKTTCLNIKNEMLPSIDSEENIELILKEDSLKDNVVTELNNVSEDHRICRFCMKMTKIGYYTYLQENKENVFMLDVVQKCIPELNLKLATKEIVSCTTCLDSLQNLFHFIRDCWNAEKETNRNIEEIDIKDQLKLIDVKNILKSDVSDINISKAEEIYEENNDNVVVKDEIKNESFMETGDEIKDEDIPVVENPELNIKNEEVESFRNTTSLSPLENTNLCMFKEYEITHQDPSRVTVRNIERKIYKCERCTYEHKLKSKLTAHMLIHRDLSQLTMYNCERCSFKTKYKGYLKKHMLTHQELSEVKLYRCETCSFETKRKGTLAVHMLIHQELSQITVYKCDRCSFETKRKGCLKKHMLGHQDPLEIKMYKCETCSYQTRYESTLKTHRGIHLDQSEIRKHKCEKCTYRTKRKYDLNKHMLTHQDVSELTMFKCESCIFVTKHKWSFKQHTRTHQKHSRITAYKCEVFLQD